MEILYLPKQAEADLTFSSSELFGRSLPLEHPKRMYRRRAFRKPTLESPRLCVRFSFQGPRQCRHRCRLLSALGSRTLLATTVSSTLFSFRRALLLRVGQTEPSTPGGEAYLRQLRFVNSLFCLVRFAANLSKPGRLLRGGGFYSPAPFRQPFFLLAIRSRRRPLNSKERLNANRTLGGTERAGVES